MDVSEADEAGTATDFDEADCELLSLLDAVGHKRIDILQSLHLQCLAVALVQFACAPLIFLAAYRGYEAVAGLILGLMMLSSTALQYWLARRLLSWLRSQPGKGTWQHAIEALASTVDRVAFGMPCAATHGLVCVFGMVEAIDPALDAWAAANAWSLWAGPVKRKFQSSWKSVPVIGSLVAWLGLPGVLLLILGGSMLCQLVALWWEDGHLTRRLDVFTEEGDETTVRSRFRVWYSWKHLTDLGGLLILHDAFEKLVYVELGHDTGGELYPVVDRQIAFIPKVVAEALPSFWFQISVLALTYDSTPSSTLAINLASIGSSMICITKLLYLQASTLLVSLPPHLACSRHILVWFANAMSCLFVLCCFPLCLIRLASVWVCPSHILLLSQGCFEPEH